MRSWGRPAGPALALIVFWLLPNESLGPDGQLISLGSAGRSTGGIALWMAVWWMTEAIPVYATALVPLAVLPLVGAASMKAAAAPYGHELIFLFMGGFILALAMERWGLHRRAAFLTLRIVGSRPTNVIGGFMLASAALSMWVSNTATAIMMLPVALSVVDLVQRGSGTEDSPAHEDFGIALLLGIAYAASIGGVGTLIGTPPNLFLASFLQSELGIEISFVRWMGVGLPLVCLFLPITWWLLTRVLFRVPATRIEGGGSIVADALARMGPLGAGERATLVVFLATSSCWIFRPLLQEVVIFDVQPFSGLSDAGIAMLAALTLFLIPVDRSAGEFAMDWETAVRLPWGLLVLFGGGLSLAAAIRSNGVGEYLGSQLLGVAGIPTPLIVMVVVALMIFLTELTSNTATTATLVPILAALAPGFGVSPLLLAVPAAIAASCAFMLPVATPPNAVVFGSGRVSIPQMSRAGLALNLIGIVLITALTYAIVIPVLSIPR